MPGARAIRTSDNRWAVRFTGPEGRRRTYRCAAYKLGAEQIHRKIDMLLDALRANESVPSEAREWAEALDPQTQTKFIAWGLLSSSHNARVLPIEQHVETWENAMRKTLEARGKRPRRASDAARQARTLLEIANIERLADLSTERVEAGIQRMREREAGSAPATLRGHQQAVRQFARWCVRENYLVRNPLATTDSITGGAQRERRALSEDEQRWLLFVTNNGPTSTGRTKDGTIKWQTTGAERALVYRILLSTGLRANELRSLTRSSFKLNSTRPTLRLKAEHDKSGRGYTWPLKPKLAEMLREHMARKLKSMLREGTANKADAAPAFSMPPSSKTARVIRADLAAARRAWIDSAGDDYTERLHREESEFLAETTELGRFDFHAMRKTYVTNLCRAGVPLAVAVQMARHRDPAMTTQIYTQLGADDNQVFADKLPDLDFAEPPGRVAATGTGEGRAPMALHEGGAECMPMSANVTFCDADSDDEETPPEETPAGD